MIISKLNGGLGNQMFQYAAARSLSIKKSQDLKIYYDNIHGVSERKFQLDAFALRENFDFNLVNKCLFLINGGFIINDESGWENAIHNSKSILMNGFWQSEKYFIDNKDLVLKDFCFIKPLNEEYFKISKMMQSTNSVSVHVRRGDYVSNQIAANVLGFCGLDYYRDAMNKIQMELGRVNFFVFSEDVDWVREELGGGKNILYVSGGLDVEDMNLMSQSKHNIIANSTFSWWAAYLNKNSMKVIIAPKKWYKDVSFENKDLIPKSWIRL